jgi:hypothetical protein
MTTRHDARRTALDGTASERLSVRDQAIRAPILDAFGHTLLGDLLALVALVAMRTQRMR